MPITIRGGPHRGEYTAATALAALGPLLHAAPVADAQQILTRLDFRNLRVATLAALHLAVQAEAAPPPAIPAAGPLPPAPPLPRPIRLAPPPPVVTGVRELDQTLGAIHHALSSAGVAYAIHGSCAALMHGAVVRPPPGDIDVLIDRQLMHGVKVMSVAPFRATTHSRVVCSFVHANGTDVQLVEAGEFGMPIGNRITVHGISVLRVDEVLISLLLRPARQTNVMKDILAFATLAAGEGQHLSVDLKAKIAKMFSAHFGGLLRLEAPVSWDAMIDMLRHPPVPASAAAATAATATAHHS